MEIIDLILNKRGRNRLDMLPNQNLNGQNGYENLRCSEHRSSYGFAKSGWKKGKAP